METRECIKTRRSIRRFTDQPVPDEVLAELLEAVRWAPSWSNTQCWEIIVVKDDETKQQLAGLLAENNPAAKGVKDAPLILVLCARKGVSGYKKGELDSIKGDWCMFDLGIAAQNLCLAAHDMGLGTVNVAWLDNKGVDELLNLPEGIESFEIIPVGYPAREGNAPPRKELSEFVHLGRYGVKFSI